MFKPGDRVRYTGKSTVYNVKARIGQTGTVVPLSDGSHMVQVRWDEKKPPLADEGGVYPENLELIGLQVGDRVRYVGKTASGKPYSPESRGTITGFGIDCGVDAANVDWDRDAAGHRPPTTAYLTNLEIIMPAKTTTIDTAKPLVLLTPGQRATPVKFLATTAEGLMIDTTGAGKDSQWMIFTNKGNFLRSATGGGAALTLANKPEAVIHRFDVMVVDGLPFFAPRDGIGGDVHVSVEDGVVVSVTGKS